FKFEILCCFSHLRFELLEKLGQLLFVADVGDGRIEFGLVEGDSDVVGFDDMSELHVHALDDGLRRDVVFDVESKLLGAAAISLVDGFVHRLGTTIRIEKGATFDVTRTAADRLNERSGTAEITFLVGVENGNERDFGKIEAFSKQVDANENVEFS